MKKQIGGIVSQPSLGLTSGRPLTRAEQNPVKIPDLNDKAAIEAQRAALRQQEANRGNSQG
jgi:hypothetical protein